MNYKIHKMNEEFLIYEVKPNETLSDIAEKIGMSTEQLKDFHNVNCKDFSLPWFNNFFGIQKIVIPKNYKSPQQIWKEISEMLPSKAIQKGFFAKKYFVRETFEKIGEEKKKYEYSFEINLKKEKEEWISEVIQSGHITNHEKPDRKTNNLGLVCMEAISPIELKISDKGEIIELSEKESLKKKFENKRIEIEEFYTDEISKRYLNNFQKKLGEEGTFYKQIRSTLLYQLMFPKLELFWKKEKFTNEIFVILNSIPIKSEFKTRYNIEGNNITIEFIGKIIENCTLTDLLQNIRYEDEKNNENQLDGHIKFSYIYNSVDKKITNAEAVVLLLNEEEIYINHQIIISQND